MNRGWSRVLQPGTSGAETQPGLLVPVEGLFLLHCTEVLAQGWGSGLAVSACLRVFCAVGEGTLGTRVGNEETGSVTQTSNAVAGEGGSSAPV